MKLKKQQHWTEVRDPYHLAPYAFYDRQWVGFDDVQSISIKAQYIKAMQLAGGMIWSVETDDFRGKCGEKYPLLNAINRVFKSDSAAMPLPDLPQSPLPSQPDSHSSTPSTSVTKPWVWASSSTARPTAPSSPMTSFPTSSSTTMTWWPRPSSQSPSTSSVVWWSSTPSSSSSSTSWPWAPTHPPSHTSSHSKPEEMTSPSTTSTTTTSTTTERPSSPGHEVEGESNSNPHQGFTCTAIGIFKHEKDCQKFYRCIGTQLPNVFKPFEYSCPANTVFNPKTSLCDWVENVPECAKRVPKHFFRFNSFKNHS